ncbi:MAG: ribonuclease J [Deltaproteobacteria bacterium]|nr:ribonuclease J [Deltaproteobacteria bacterium]
MTDSLRFIPLGGLCEVGMNCAALAWGDATIAIDCGVGFTDELGADMVHPNFGWLYEQGERLRAIVVTHGHEDHIGALPYFLKRFRVPVYAPPYAAALIQDRLAEHRLEDVELRVGAAGSRFKIGPFGIERFGVHHSIADATGLILDTPVGTVVHTGDFKIESEPCAGQRFDRKRLEEAARDGVRLLLSDSTGADVEGTSDLERNAETALEQWVARSPHRVVVATFSSNVFRLRAAFRIAREHGRKVCLLGMSVRKHTETASDLDLIPPVESVLVSAEEATTLPRDQVMIIAGGTQGERGSSLTRLAHEEHSYLHLSEGDTVIFSSRIIPGNELPVLDVINRFEERGIEVITRHEHPEIHASGHGSREEQRAMIRLLQPQAFVPVHGTHHHLRRHAELAREEGVTEIEILQNGSVLEVTRDSLAVVDSVPVGRVYVEGMEPLGDRVMEDRRAMASGGIVTILISIKDGKLRSSPRVLARGVVGNELRSPVEQKLADHVRSKLKGRRFTQPEKAEEAAIEAARRFLIHNHRKRPLITAVVDGGS